MCLTICSNKTCPVHCKDHMKLLHAHIVKHLIHSSLQKGGINGNHRNHSAKCQSGCKGNRMLFCNSHIKEPIRKSLGKLFQPGTIRHGSCNGNQLLFFCCHLAQSICKHIRIARTDLLLGWLSSLDVKRSDSMKHIRILSCRFIATSLFCKNMNHNRPFHTLCLIKKTHHLAHIMPVHRSKIGQSHIFKEHSRNKKLLNAAFRPSHSIHHSGSHTGNLFYRLIQAHFHSGVCFCSTDRTEII